MPYSLAKLDLESQRAVDVACDRFEAALKTPSPLEIEDCLALVPEHARPALLVELLHLEATAKAAHGSTVDWEAYRARFTGNAAAVESAFASLHASSSAASGLATASSSSGGSEEDLASRPSLQTSELPSAVGRFRILAKLGSGSFGIVYRAFDPTLDREVALKVLQRQSGDVRRAERFLGEAKAAARLQHPHIVAVFERGEADGQLYISADYIEGETVGAVMAREAVAHRQTAEWIRDLASALDYAHGCGVVHRDIKPDNIMLSATGRVMVMDFGLAKRTLADAAASPLETADGAILGTPAYMSPEQARGEAARVGPASDQYSLGVVLYELLTRRRPFQGDAFSIIAQVGSSQEPPRPRALVRGLPRDLEAICLKAMEKSPAARYPRCADLARDLEHWLADRPTMARPASSALRFGKWLRRNPVVGGLSTATFLLLIVALVSVSLALRFADSERRVAQTSLGAIRRQEAATAAARDVAERQSYRTAIALAQRSLAEGSYAEARRLLERCAANRRGWEWRLLAQRLPVPQSRIARPAFAPYLRFTPDGDQLAIQSGDAVALFDVQSGQPRGEISGGNASAAHFGPQFDPSGRWLFLGARARGSAAARGLILNVIDRETRARVTELDQVWSIGESRVAGLLPILHVDATAKPPQSWETIWNSETKSEVETWRGPPLWQSELWCTTIAASGRRYSRHVEEGVSFYDLASGDQVDEPELARLEVGYEATHRDGNRAVAFVPRAVKFGSDQLSAGTFVVVAINPPRLIARLDASATPELLAACVAVPSVRRPRWQFSHDGQTVWATLHVLVTQTHFCWDVASGRYLGAARGAAVSPSKRCIAASDHQGVSIDNLPGDEAAVLHFNATPPLDRSVTWLADGTLVATVGPKRKPLVDAARPLDVPYHVETRSGLKLISATSFDVGPCARTSDGILLAAAFPQLDLLAPTGDAATRRQHVAGVEGAAGVPGPLAALAELPALSALLAVSREGRAWIIDREASPRAVAALDINQGRVADVAVSADGRTWAVGSAQGISIFAGPSRRAAWPIAGPSLRQITLNRDGQLLAASDADGRARVWKISTQSIVQELSSEPSLSRHLAIAFHPREDRLAAGDSAGSLRLFDTRHWDEVLRLDLPSAPFGRLSFSPDGSRLAASLHVHGAASGQIRIWRVD